MEQWQDKIIESEAEILDLLTRTKRIAVLGIKVEEERGKPAFYVPEYMLHSGYDIIPVPVYYPDVTTILGRQVYRRLVDIPGHVDMVNVFRRPGDIPAHLNDILRKCPTSVWFQLGIRNDVAAKKLAEAGILVVQDRCIMVEHRRMKRK